MKDASELRPRMAIRFEGALWKVLSANYHYGGGKMGGLTLVKMRNPLTGAVREVRLHAGETVEEVTLDRETLEFLYTDGSTSTFMNPRTFDQVELDNERLGPAARFLKEQMPVSVEFLDGEPLTVDFPPVVEAVVAETGPPAHTGGGENVKKEARLENGVTLLVPQFIVNGDRIHVDVESGAYVDRVKK